MIIFMRGSRVEESGVLKSQPPPPKENGSLLNLHSKIIETGLRTHPLFHDRILHSRGE